MTFAADLRKLAKEAESNADEVGLVQKSKLCAQWEEEYVASIKAELTKRASHGCNDAYMNFDRAKFSNTGLGRPAEMLELFLTELSNPESTLCTEAGCLQDIGFEVWNNAKFTAKFTW